MRYVCTCGSDLVLMLPHGQTPPATQRCHYCGEAMVCANASRFHAAEADADASSQTEAATATGTHGKGRHDRW